MKFTTTEEAKDYLKDFGIDSDDITVAEQVYKAHEQGIIFNSTAQGHLKFDLESNFEGFLAAVHGRGMKIAIWDLDQQLRSWWKYGHQFDDVDDCIDKVREELRYHLESQSVPLELVL